MSDIEDFENLKHDLAAGRWLRKNATSVLIALIDARPSLAHSMCIEAFGLTAEQIREAIEERRRREAAERETP